MMTATHFLSFILVRHRLHGRQERVGLVGRGRSASALRSVKSSAGGASAAGAGAGAPIRKLYLSSKSLSFCCFFAMAAAGSAWFSRMSPTSDGITKMTKNASTPSAT